MKFKITRLAKLEESSRLEKNERGYRLTAKNNRF